jgi:hypothetical protein
MRLVSSAMPPPSVERRKAAVRAAAAYALSRGITSVVDLGRCGAAHLWPSTGRATGAQWALL